MNKKTLLLLAVIGAAVVSALSTRLSAQSESEVQIGLQIAPVPLNLRGKNVALVGKGSYLVNTVGDCNGCHSVNFSPYLPGRDPFFGEPEGIDPEKYLVGGSAFGPFISRNLRPRADTGLPAGYTFEQFVRIMRQGDDLKHIAPSDLLQVMSWPSFRRMTDNDLRAMYEYLRALPPHPEASADALSADHADTV